MAKNDGTAEVTLFVSADKPLDVLCGRQSPKPPSFQVIINHFEGEPEIWDTFKTEQEAIEEVFKWNNGLWGEGFTHSAEELRLQALKEAEESKRRQ